MRSTANALKHMEGIFYPRNPKQASNVQSKVRKDGKHSYDSLCALHILVDQLNRYILQIKTTPDIQVIVGMKDFRRVQQTVTTERRRCECLL